MISRPIIELDNITVVYHENTPFEVVVLKNFSVKINKGDIVVVKGANGSGKTTLLNAINGTIPIKSGNIFFYGTNVTRWSPYKRAEFIGSVYQDTMLGTCPNLSIQENFQLTNPSRWWQPVPYQLKLNQKHIDSLKKAGLLLESRGISKVNMLSGGQRQVIAICLAFENKKSVLLFDEFVSSLDDLTTKRMINFTIDQAKSNGSTIIMVMHHLNNVSSDITRIINL